MAKINNIRNHARFRPQELYQVSAEIQNRLGPLSSTRARLLATWVVGIRILGSCSLTELALLWAGLSRGSANACRERLRYFYKAGTTRGKTWSPASCFADLLSWSWEWMGGEAMLALDATHLKQRFIVLSISVLNRQCAVPVAWSIRNAFQRGAWKPVWQDLLRSLRPALGAPRPVWVLADRGLYAPWLFHEIVALGALPLLRLHRQGRFLADGQAEAMNLAHENWLPGCFWSDTGWMNPGCAQAFRCRLTVIWEPAQAEPWILMTPEAAEPFQARRYAKRMWIETGFKRLKRGGWQWQNTRMSDPARAEKLWLALAVATLWTLCALDRRDATELFGALWDQAGKFSHFLIGKITAVLALVQPRFLRREAPC